MFFAKIFKQNKPERNMGKAIENVKKIHSEFFDKFKTHIITAITAAFALVIALSWNDAIRQGVDQLIAKWGITGTSYLIKVVSALIVTGVCVLGIYLVSKLEKKKEIP